MFMLNYEKEFFDLYSVYILFGFWLDLVNNFKKIFNGDQEV